LMDPQLQEQSASKNEHPNYFLIMKYSGIICWIAITLAIQSCAFLHFNPSGKAFREGKYPKFTREDSLLGTLNPQRSCFDVTYYNLTIEPLIDKKRLRGEVEIFFTVTKPTNVIQIDLDQKFDISSISSGAEIVSFKREFRGVRLNFGRTLNPGEKSIIKVSYEGKPVSAKRPPWEGGLVWKKDKNKKPWIGVACEDEGASIWWPLKDHIADEPDSVGVNIIVPKGLKGISNGRLTAVKDLGNNREIFEWRTSYPVNNYNITFYIGDFRKITIPYKITDSLQFYVLPYSEAKAGEHFRQAVPMMEFFEEAFGEYPWWKDGYKVVESPFEGMEHQSAIAYGNGYKNDPPYFFDYIVLHESAHEWWGNSLTATDMAELWLHEGFATYAEALYVEKTYGYDAYLQYLLMYRYTILNKRPVIGPRDVFYSNYKDGDLYTKGAWFLHSLRFAIGNDTIFRDIIKSFAVNNRVNHVTTSDFLKLVNEKTGKDFTWIFNQYLYNRKPPRLIYSTEERDGEYFLKYRWEDIVDGFNLPVLINYNFGADVWLHPTRDIQEYKLKAGYFSFPYYPYYFGSKKVKKFKD
jgi:aminopeptidase N